MAAFLPGWRHPHICKGTLLVAYKQIPTQCGKEYPEFQFMATDFILMAAKMSDRGDNMSEANLQADGLVEKSAQGAADWQETEEEVSSPHNLPMWSPVQRPPTGHFNMNYCLEIQVTSTDELGDTPPPLHAWTAPVVEDML